MDFQKIYNYNAYSIKSLWNYVIYVLENSEGIFYSFWKVYYDLFFSVVGNPDVYLKISPAEVKNYYALLLACKVVCFDDKESKICEFYKNELAKKYMTFKSLDNISNKRQ